MMSVNNIGISNKSQNHKFKKPLNAMLDSGTTYTYLRADAFTQMQNIFNGFCAQKSATKMPLCGGNPRWNRKSYCANYDPKVYKNINNFFNSFPRFYTQFPNSATHIWFAKDYMMQAISLNSGIQRYCISIMKSQPSRPNSTLGSTFFRHYDIYFDRDHKQISFVRSECDDKAPRAYPVYGIRSLIRKARILLSGMFGVSKGMFDLIFVSIGILLVLVNVGIWIVYKRKNKKNNNQRDRERDIRELNRDYNPESRNTVESNAKLGEEAKNNAKPEAKATGDMK